MLLSVVCKHYVDLKAEPAGYGKDIRPAFARIQQVLKDKLQRPPKVADLTRMNQRHLMKAIVDEGLRSSTAQKHLAYIRSAVNFAAEPQIVEIDGEDVEICILRFAPKIFTGVEEIEKTTGQPVLQKRGDVPTFRQMAEWIDSLDTDEEFRYAIIGLNTWARPGAIMDLHVSDQVDFNIGLVDLNPPGRAQNRKRRPVIRLTENLRGWLQSWGDDHPMALSEHSDNFMKRINTRKAGIVRYTLRHFMATRIRRIEFGDRTLRVSKEQRSLWLGHDVSEGSQTTDWYEQFDPEYLSEALQGTDLIMRKLDAKAKKTLFAPTAHPRSVKNAS